MQQISKELF